LQLKELRLNNFGKFHNKTIKLEEGINLIYGDNEAGKSTVHSFVRGMLFGIEKLRGRASKDDVYLKYQPWDTPGAYSGSMDFKVEEKTYRILRNFEKNTKNCSVIDLQTGRELNLHPEELKDLYGGLTESGFRNTISIEQLKSRTEYELVEEVRNYITNLSLSKSNEVDVTKALSFLQDKRKEIEAQQISSKIATLEEEIAVGLASETKIDGLTIQLSKVEEQLRVLRKKKEMDDGSVEELEGFASIEAYHKYLDQLPAIKEKYRSYCERLSQHKALSEKQNIVQKQFHELEENQDETILIKIQIRKMEELKTELSTLQAKKSDLIAKVERKPLSTREFMSASKSQTGGLKNEKGIEKEKGIQKERYKNLTFCILLAIIGIIGTLCFLGKNSMMLGISVAIAFGSCIIYLSLSHRTRLKQRAFDQVVDGYEKEIDQLQTKERDILLHYKNLDEQDLKKKQEEALRREMSLEHLLKQKKDYQEQVTLLEEKIAILKQEILDYRKQTLDILSVKESSIQALDDSVMGILEEHIVRQKQRIARNQETTAQEYENGRIQMEKLKWELNVLEGNEEKLLQNKDLHKKLVQQRSENELELAAIKLAIETINNLSVDIHDSFGYELNHLVSNLAGQITDGKYVDIKVDEKLNIKVGHKDNFVLLDKLSAGTIEQLYFALRIAISNLVYGEGTMPILLDDCFALYDDNRTKAALESLSKDRKGQVLIFTCHSREKAMLDQMKINYQYIDLQ